MPETITFRGAVLRDMDLRQAAKGASTFLRMHLVSDFTDVIREALEWEDLPDSYKDASPKDAVLNGVKLHVKPNGRELNQYAFSMPIRQVKDFRVNTIKEGEEEIRQLSFTVETNVKKAYSTVGKFIEAVGLAKCQVKIEYATEEENADGTKQEQLLTSEEMRAAAKSEND